MSVICVFVDFEQVVGEASVDRGEKLARFRETGKGGKDKRPRN